MVADFDKHQHRLCEVSESYFRYLVGEKKENPNLDTCKLIINCINCTITQPAILAQIIASTTVIISITLEKKKA